MAATADSPLLADDARHRALLSEFYWRLDHPGSGTVADLFTEAGTIARRVSNSRGARRSRSGSRPGTAHHATRWSNLRLTRAAGRCFRSMRICRPPPGPRARQRSRGIMISETHDMVVRDEQGACNSPARPVGGLRGRLSAGELTRHETGNLSSRWTVSRSAS